MYSNRAGTRKGDHKKEGKVANLKKAAELEQQPFDRLIEACKEAIKLSKFSPDELLISLGKDELAAISLASGSCHGYLYGFMDVHYIYESALNKRVFCLPDKLNFVELANVIVENERLVEKEGRTYSGLGVGLILIEKFPCKP